MQFLQKMGTNFQNDLLSLGSQAIAGRATQTAEKNAASGIRLTSTVAMCAQTLKTVSAIRTFAMCGIGAGSILSNAFLGVVAHDLYKGADNYLSPRSSLTKAGKIDDLTKGMFLQTFAKFILTNVPGLIA